VPVKKFRSAADMPRPPRATDGGEVLDHMRAMWRRAALLAPPAIVPRGLTRFRTIQEANAARAKLTVERMRRSRVG